jgi:hypothetical protein
MVLRKVRFTPQKATELANKINDSMDAVNAGMWDLRKSHSKSVPDWLSGIDGSGTSRAELPRGGGDVESKPTANPRSCASLGLLQGACGRCFRAADPRGNPPLPARNRG